jgi:hypothetical protein
MSPFRRRGFGQHAQQPDHIARLAGRDGRPCGAGQALGCGAARGESGAPGVCWVSPRDHGAVCLCLCSCVLWGDSQRHDGQRVCTGGDVWRVPARDRFWQQHLSQRQAVPPALLQLVRLAAYGRTWICLRLCLGRCVGTCASVCLWLRVCACASSALTTRCVNRSPAASAAPSFSRPSACTRPTRA